MRRGVYDAHPCSLVARRARRDQGTNSDRFQVFIDPYHDKRSGFYFGVTAAGTLHDGTLFNDEWDDDSWDGVWEGKVTRDATGWTAELRIPYSQLRFVRQQQYVWGINFRRDIAPEVDPPDVLLLANEAQLRIGNPQLRRPTGRVARDLPLPHTVPAVVVPLIVEERAVVQRARSGHAEVEPAA